MDTAAQGILTRDEMESRRLLAAQDLQRGLSQSQVARKFGVSRTTASRWYRSLSGKGVESLRKRRAPGRPSRLTAEQLPILRRSIRRDRGQRASTPTAGPPPASPTRFSRVSACATIPITWAASCTASVCASVAVHARSRRTCSTRSPARGGTAGSSSRRGVGAGNCPLGRPPALIGAAYFAPA